MSLLDAIDVSFACPAAWDKMHGDDTSRFCGYCKKFVYNFSHMTRAQAEAFIVEKEGALCARFYRRADGRIVTRDCAPIPRRGIPYPFLLVFTFIGLVASWILGFMSHKDGQGPVYQVINWLCRSAK